MNRVTRIQCGNGNCFLVEENGKSILIDTARPKYRDKILAACKTANVQLIVLTHGHVDHIQNAAYLAEQLAVPIAINQADCKLITNNMEQALSADGFLGKVVLKLLQKSLQNDRIEPFTPTVFLKQGDTLTDFGSSASILDLPGHTQGSIGLNLGGTDLIVGDALMNLISPKVSMLYENKDVMLESAKKIGNMGQMKIHFGHGKSVQNRIWVK